MTENTQDEGSGALVTPHETIPLSPDEIHRLREFLRVADDVRKDAEYRMARRLVLKTWRQGLILVGFFGSALLAFREYAGKAIAFLLGIELGE